MTWLKANVSLVMAILMVVLVAGLLLATMYYRNLSVTVGNERDKALQQQKSAEAVTTNVIAAVRLFNDIAESTRSDKQKATDDSEQRIVYIREAVKNDKCAVLPVPVAAADSLRAHRNQIRSGAGSSDTSRVNR